MVGRRIEVVEAADGTFGIADMGPVTTSGPRPNYPSNYYPYDPYYGRDPYGGYDPYGGGYYHEYPQYYPGFPDYGWNPVPSYPDPYYPSGPYGGGGTSPGDDY
jgi:hypothetical protein